MDSSRIGTAYRPVRCVGGLSERHRLRRDIAAAAAVRCAQTACQESSVLRVNYCHYSFVCIHGLASFSTVPYCDLVTFKSNLNCFMKAPPLPFMPVSPLFFFLYLEGFLGDGLKDDVHLRLVVRK